MKKCPPNTLCISNISFTLGFIIFLIITIVFWCNYKSNVSPNNIKQEVIIKENDSQSLLTNFIPNIPYRNFTESVLLDPYVPPLKDERYLVPINIPTNIGAVNTNYRQLGILTPLNGVKKDEILPLMGRPLFTNRQKFQYYTISNQYNNVKLPVIVKGRSGTTEYGVDEIYNGDTIYIEGLEQPFKCTIYENNTIQYLPY